MQTNVSDFSLTLCRKLEGKGPDHLGAMVGTFAPNRPTIPNKTSEEIDNSRVRCFLL